MISISPWFDRSFRFDLEGKYFPLVLERLFGTSVRLANAVKGVPETALRFRPEETWSIQEHAGHLLDLEPLWYGRVDDILSGATEMRAADLQNRATMQAHHNDRAIEEIVDEFEAQRQRLTSRLAGLPVEDVLKSAKHPRLKQPMRIIDLGLFVAEHDDHHLATIRQRLLAGEAS